MEDCQKNIRNFCIISHIDHGKSTLADRFLELTGTIEKSKMHEQYLDQMDLERERGITIKLQPVRMVWRLPNDANRAKIPNPKFSFDKLRTSSEFEGQILNKSQIQNSKNQNSFEFRASNFEFPNSEYILNLIDTPGHVDFSYEVSRSLAAVEGAILLVDATKSIQAQTLTNLHLAQKQGIVIITAVNKIDLQNARIEEAKNEIASLLGINPNEVFEISAKLGTGVEELLEAVIEKIPPPAFKISDAGSLFRALVFDSDYDPYKGVIAYIRVFDGQIKRGEGILLLNQKVDGEALEVGIFKPQLEPKEELLAGEIGYIATGVKEPDKVRVGETITAIKQSSNQAIKQSSYKQTNHQTIQPLAGYKEPKPMVFASFFTENAEDYDLLQEAIKKLKLNDASLFFENEYSQALGRGFKCGFLGMLHMEIVSERLKREFGLPLIITSPTVLYEVVDNQGNKKLIYTPEEFPDKSLHYSILEPWVRLEIITPVEFLGQILKLLKTKRGDFKNTDYLTSERILITHEAPLSEIIIDFYDKLKGISSGYASMNYELGDFREADLEKLEILVAGEKVPALSRIVFSKRVFEEGRKMVENLKEALPPQNFAVAIQAAIGGRIIARETKKALKKDVIAGLYGGDYTRKRKLLEKQKKGKKKMRAIGRVKIPSEVFLKILKG